MGRLGELVDNFLEPELDTQGKIIQATLMVELVILYPPIENQKENDIKLATECIDQIAGLSPVLGGELRIYWYRRDRIITAAEAEHEYYNYVLDRIREIREVALIRVNEGIIPDWESRPLT